MIRIPGYSGTFSGQSQLRMAGQPRKENRLFKSGWKRALKENTGKEPAENDQL